MAYECAQNIYVHFYGASRIFDWYHMDAKMLLRAVMALNAFTISSTSIRTSSGTVVRAVPERVASTSRDAHPTREPWLVRWSCWIAWATRAAGSVGRRLGDLACGSGSFLVEACRRLLDRYAGPRWSDHYVEQDRRSRQPSTRCSARSSAWISTPDAAAGDADAAAGRRTAGAQNTRPARSRQTSPGRRPVFHGEQVRRLRRRTRFS